MTEPLSPEERQNLYAGYVLYDLSPEEAASLEQMMAADPAIAAEIAQLQQALDVVQELPAVAPPPTLRAAVMAAHQSAQAGQPVPFARPRPATAPWIKAWGVAAAVLIVGLSVSNYRLWRTLQATQIEMAQVETQVLVLQPTTAEISGFVSVEINADDLNAVLTVKDLPPLSPGQVYVLWTVLEPDAPFTVDDKNAILTQTFNVNADGSLSEQIPLPLAFRDRDAVTAVAITIEDATAPQRHESSPLLIQRL